MRTKPNLYFHPCRYAAWGLHVHMKEAVFGHRNRFLKTKLGSFNGKRRKRRYLCECAFGNRFSIWKSIAADLLSIPVKSVTIDASPRTEESELPETMVSNISVMTQLVKKCCIAIQKLRFRQPLPIRVKRSFVPGKKRVGQRVFQRYSLLHRFVGSRSRRNRT